MCKLLIVCDISYKKIQKVIIIMEQKKIWKIPLIMKQKGWLWVFFFFFELIENFEICNGNLQLWRVAYMLKSIKNTMPCHQSMFLFLFFIQGLDHQWKKVLSLSQLSTVKFLSKFTFQLLIYLIQTLVCRHSNPIDLERKQKKAYYNKIDYSNLLNKILFIYIEGVFNSIWCLSFDFPKFSTPPLSLSPFLQTLWTP